MRERKSLVRRLAIATATMTAFAVLFAGCGSQTNNGDSSASHGQEPADGFPANWKGSYPMPSPDKAYNNSQKREAIKDGGTLNLATTETDNWNNLSNDGNTAYMGDLWKWYMPQTMDMDFKGNVTVNKNYLTKAEVTKTNPLTITYDINPKATWNDGSEIDWTAFKATWEVSNGKNAAYNPPSTTGYEDIASVERGTNDKEAVVTYSKPANPWQAQFSTLYNPKATDPKTFTEGWVNNPHNEWASGPYKVDKSDATGVTFVRNEKWWGPKPKLDKIVYRYMESVAQINAFKNGELDATLEVNSNNDLKTLAGTKNMQIRQGYSTKVRVYNYNGKSGLLKDINVRKALTMATDAKQLGKILFQGMNWTPKQAGSEIFTQFQAGYEDNRPTEMKSSNADGAKKVLEKAGYKQGEDGYYAKNGKTLSFRFTYFGSESTNTAMAKAYQQMMKQVGIKITIDNRDESKFAKTLSSHDYEIVPMAWQANSPFGQLNLDQLYGSKSPSNFTLVGSDKIDQMATKPKAIAEQVKAVKSANKVEQEALKLFGTMPFAVPPLIYAVKKGLANYGPAGFMTVHPEDIGMKK